MILHMRYLPDLTGTGPLVAELASDLAARGEKVEVITSFPHYGKRASAPSVGRGLVSRRVEDGAGVTRTLAFPYASGSVLGRAMDYGLFTSLATAVGLAGGRPEVILAVAPPITVGVAGWLVGAGRHAPLVFNAQDIWPDGLVAMGKLKNRAVIRAFHWLERFTYRAARRVTVLSQGMRENLLRKGVPDRKIVVLPNWVDLDVVRPTDKENSFRTELGLQSRFVALFAGNIGFAAGLETVLEAAHRLRREADIVFLIVGEGSAKSALAQRTQELELTNLRFVTSQPRERLSEVLGAADVSLVPLRDGMGTLSVPSKTMAIMASARPVLASVPPDSETRRLIDVSGAGRWVGAGDSAALADEIMRLHDDRSGLESMGANGRRYAEAHFGRSQVVSAYHRLLLEVAFDRPVGRHSTENTEG